MNNKSILIVAPFTSLPSEPLYNRFLHLAYILSDSYDVTLLTSSFNHAKKEHRNIKLLENHDTPFAIELIDEPGYIKNIGLGRLISHHIFTKNFERWIKKHKGNNFNLVYSAFPLITTNLILGKFKSDFEYRIVVDIQDIWPDSITAVFPFLKMTEFLLHPIRRKARKVYQLADGLVAVSQTYLDIAKKHNLNAPASAVYIGADKSLIDKIPPQKKETDKIKLLYIGTLSHSYDIETIILSINEISQKDSRVEFHIFGDGPDLKRLKKIASKAIYFHGLKLYSEMISYAKSCDILVNPIVASAQQSITNKLSDYFLLGLPIINSQKLDEVTNLIELTNGFNYEAGSIQSFSDEFQKSVKMNHNNKSVEITSPISNLFDRSQTYPQILNLIEKLID